MSTARKILNVTVGEDLRTAAARTASTLKAVKSGGKVTPYFGVSFEEIGTLLAAFTPKRWELVAALRANGPMSVAALARLLQRDYKNVHTDVTQLIEWLAIERREDGLVEVPWSDIVVDMKLP